MGPNGLRSIQFRVSILAVAAVISVSTLAQTAGTPVLFRIVLPRAVICAADRHLEVEAELRNTVIPKEGDLPLLKRPIFWAVIVLALLVLLQWIFW